MSAAPAPFSAAGGDGHLNRRAGSTPGGRAPAMHTCPQCNRAMTRDTSSGSVSFVCYCGVRVAGTAADARIAGDVLHAGETEEKYRRLIKNAPFDRVNKQVKMVCHGCGLDYMTQLRVGDREVVIWVCKCGYDSSLAAPPGPVAGAAAAGEAAPPRPPRPPGPVAGAASAAAAAPPPAPPAYSP